jgi:hypothetical protein
VARLLALLRLLEVKSFIMVVDCRSYYACWVDGLDSLSIRVHIAHIVMH